ncbi:MAG: AAA family ATPase, partial [Anaeroplasmataceae bacterium]
MNKTIKKIKLFNFRKFENFTIEFNDRINIFVGDNEVGKSSILEAIDTVISGNLKKIEKIGIENLLNINSVQKFLNGDKTFVNLPKLIIELYLDGDFDFTMDGKNNSEKKVCYGIRCICEANEEYLNEINDFLSTDKSIFPYDYYTIRFSTFSGESYSGYKKQIKSILIDSINMNSDYATSEFIKRTYNIFTADNVKERVMHKS